MPRKEPIRLKAKQPEDRFGDPEGPEPQWRDVPGGAIVVPRSSQDYEQRGPIVVSGYMIVVGPKVAVEHNDQVEVRGEVHDIEGDIADYRTRKLFYTIQAS
jgi:hypothetical protein